MKEIGHRHEVTKVNIVFADIGRNRHVTSPYTLSWRESGPNLGETPSDTHEIRGLEYLSRYHLNMTRFGCFFSWRR
jgi:hypothetical protein